MDILNIVAWAIANISPVNLGVVGDKCSIYPNSLEHMAELSQDLTDLHRYQIRIEDKSCTHDILRGDSFHARVRLESAPAGLQICVQMKPAQAERVCGKTYYELIGTSGFNDSQEVTIWVFWHSQAKPVAGSYRLVISGI